MQYFAFLAYFLLIPILLLLFLLQQDKKAGRKRPFFLTCWPVGWAIILHVFIAVIYTTPWDNYLVATRVWWYDPALVTGLTLGWVPIEEYTFFVLQPILGGLWLSWLANRIPETTAVANPAIRRNALLLIGALWLLMLYLLIAPAKADTYLGLELVWALPPIMLQLGFGADLLWQRRGWVAGTILSLTFYLSAADALAIEYGTWTIDPEQSLGLLLGGILPIEEFIFFLLTNTLVTFGIFLIWHRTSHDRLSQLRERLGK